MVITADRDSTRSGSGKFRVQTSTYAQPHCTIHSGFIHTNLPSADAAKACGTMSEPEPRPRAGVLITGGPSRRNLARKTTRSPAFPEDDVRERRLGHERPLLMALGLIATGRSNPGVTLAGYFALAAIPVTPL